MNEKKKECEISLYSVCFVKLKNNKKHINVYNFLWTVYMFPWIIILHRMVSKKRKSEVVSVSLYLETSGVHVKCTFVK